MKLIRTFHPVGHGAFYTERFYDDSQNVVNVVFDCGCYEGPKSCKSKQYYEKRINDIVDVVFPLSNEKIKIDALFISHFHTDHINGIPRLLKNCDVRRVIMPKLTDDAYMQAIMYSHFVLGADIKECIDVLEQFKSEIRYDEETNNVIEVDIDEGDSYPSVVFDNVDMGQLQSSISKPTVLTLFSAKWKYIPFSTKERKQQLINALKQGVVALCPALSKVPVDFKAIAQLLTNQPTLLNQCKTVYENVFGGKNYHNSYSMTLFSGTCESSSTCAQQCHQHIKDLPRYCTKNCMYMGDFEAHPKKSRKNTNGDQFLTFYDKFWKKVGIIQVPHHGSRDNMNIALYSPPKIALISAGKDDVYNNPHLDVIVELQKQNCIPIVVTEAPSTVQQYVYEIV